MRLRKVTLVLLCVLVIGAIAPAAGYASFYNSKATSADAWWSSWNPESGEPGPGDATVDWSVSGSAGSGIFKDAGIPLDVFKGSNAWASRFSYTPASGETPATWTEFICFTETPSVLTFGKSLASAQLEYLAEGTANVWTGSAPWVEIAPDEWELREPEESTTEMVSVVADWKATGGLTKSTWVNRERSAEYLWADRSNQQYRRAAANVLAVGASGTVYLDGTANEAQISTQKSTGRMRGEMPY